MKKILLWGMMMLLPAMAGAESVKIGGLYYNLDGEAMTAEVVNGFGYTVSGKVVIPGSVDYEGGTYAVTRIGDYAFSTSADVTEVEVPASVREVGRSAFNDCLLLRDVYYLQTYDTNGRPKQQWFPVVGSTAASNLSASSIASLSQSTHQDSYAYFESHYDALDNVTATDEAGSEWHSEGKQKVKVYDTNVSNEVNRYGAGASGVLLNCKVWKEDALLALRSAHSYNHSPSDLENKRFWAKSAYMLFAPLSLYKYTLIKNK